MRDAANIRSIEQTGIDWMGFIFYPPSPRYVNEPPEYLPESVKRVGVFVHPDFQNVNNHIKQYHLQAVQFCGKASPEMCQRFRDMGILVIRVVPVTETFVSETAEYVGKVDYFLFDTPTLKFGGSGRSYNWSLLARYPGPTPFLLSGGLSPSSIDALRAFQHPCLAGYDINSGFELSPALKDVSAVINFVQQIKKTQL